MPFPLGSVAPLGALGSLLWFAASRNWLRRFAPERPRSVAEWTLLALTPLLGAAAYWPFCYNGLLGVGDSYHYTLQVADAVTQARQGHWPLIAGQSVYAFNGNIHTLRTAPYFTHVAAALDLLSGHTLEFWQLTNLVIFGTGALSAWLVYVCARWISPEARLLAALLAVLYAWSPALGTPLMSQDMIATFVAAPWLPLVCGSVVQCWNERTSTPWLLLAFSLGLTWLAHPPTALWITPMSALAIGAWVFNSKIRHPFRSAAGAVCLFAALGGYVFYSVYSLRVPGAIHADRDASGAAISNLATSWPDAWKPLDLASKTSGNIQLGYALWLAVLLAIFALRRSGRRNIAAAVLLYFLLLLSLLAPVPLYSPWFWSHLPQSVMVITNDWPMQRLYAVLASVAVIFTATSFARGPDSSKRGSCAAAVACLALAAVWSGFELHKLQAHAAALRRTTEASADVYRPDQLLLTRSSYALFDAPPAYFSHGWMDPEMESRLLGLDGSVVQTNAKAIEQNSAAAKGTTTKIPLDVPFRLRLSPDTDYLFVFTFSPPEVRGEVTLRGDHLMRVFSLPLSGQARSFGSSDVSQHAFRLGVVGNGEKTFVLRAPDGTRVKAIRFRRASVPVQLRELIPYRATVVSKGAAYLETPRMFIPGYSAQVDGKDVEPVHSSQGLVAVPVPAGISNIAVRYRGPPGLRVWGWVATLGVLVGGAILVRGPRACEGNATLTSVSPDSNSVVNRKTKAVVLAVALLVAGGTAMLFLDRAPPGPQAGHLRLVVQFPAVPLVPAEPLAVFGKQGSATTVYVLYGDTTFQIGIDVWGKGGPISAPIPVDMMHPYVVDLECTAFADGEVKGSAGPLRLSVDGRHVLELAERIAPSARDEFYLGKNPAGASVCSERFTGWLEQLP